MLVSASAIQLGAPFAPTGWPPCPSAPQAEAQRRDTPRDDARAIFGADIESSPPTALLAPASVRRGCAAFVVARGRGAEKSRGKTRRADEAARAQTKKKCGPERHHVHRCSGERKGVLTELLRKAADEMLTVWPWMFKARCINRRCAMVRSCS